MSITTKRNIEFNEVDIIMVTPPQPRKAFANTPIFFEAIHEHNKKAIVEIAEGAELEVNEKALSMDDTINWSDVRSIPLANTKPKTVTPAKKSQQEARARARGLQTSTRKLRDTPQA